MWPWGLSPGSPRAFAFAATCVAVATVFHISVGTVRPETVVFAPYYAATLVAALLGGAAAGILAMILGGVIAYWLFAQANWDVALFTVNNLDNWVLYGGSSVVILWAAVSYRSLLQWLREEQRKRQLLTDELAHRLGNTLATVQAVVNQSLASETELREKISARLAALAATNDLLFKSDWQTVSLRDILIGEFRPYGSSRIHWEGEDVQCPSQVVMLLALITHELTTNAVKYGALSKPDGRIDVSWQNVDGRLTIHWVESGNLLLTPPTRKGFGTKLLSSAIRRFHGQVETRFEPSGLNCTISLALPDRCRA
jgi:two-component sensor histidine kinase